MTIQESRPEVTADATGTTPLLDVRKMKVHFPVSSGFLLGRKTDYIKAVDDVSLSVNSGETVGLVGESGSGKTTFGRAALRLLEPTAGQVFFDREELTSLTKQEMRQRR